MAAYTAEQAASFAATKTDAELIAMECAARALILGERRPTEPREQGILDAYAAELARRGLQPNNEDVFVAMARSFARDRTP